jgi:hypothetical protein
VEDDWRVCTERSGGDRVGVGGGGEVLYLLPV